MNDGRPWATGRVRQLIDILAELDPTEGDDRQAASSAGQA